MTRKPLQFDIERSPATPTEKGQATQVAPRADEGRKQVGARIPADLYRQLKSRAALQGKTVQELLEQAVAQFLA